LDDNIKVGLKRRWCEDMNRFIWLTKSPMEDLYENGNEKSDSINGCLGGRGFLE
jgi:phage terminase large subunit-like protein